MNKPWKIDNKVSYSIRKRTTGAISMLLSSVILFGHTLNGEAAEIVTQNVTNETAATNVIAVIHTIDGFLSFDNDRNGTSDIMLPNIKIDLTQNGYVLESTYTDSNGYFTFDNLMSGEYVLKINDIVIPGEDPTQIDWSTRTITVKVIADDAKLIRNHIVLKKRPTTEEPTTETPSTEVPTTETPSTEEPTTETPSTEEPTTEIPSTEEPTTETPSTEEPTTETPSTEEPTTETPSTEEPTTETPSSEEPTSETPSTEEPTSETPSTEEPTSETPSTEVPTTETPSTEVPTTETPSTEVPTTETPSTEVPTTETPSTEVPTTETPSTEVPTTETPSTEVPTTETPSTEVPTSETPSTENPTTEGPSTEGPSTETPSIEVPVLEDPAIEDPTSEDIISRTDGNEEQETEDTIVTINRPDENIIINPSITEILTGDNEDAYTRSIPSRPDVIVRGRNDNNLIERSVIFRDTNERYIEHTIEATKSMKDKETKYTSKTVRSNKDDKSDQREIIANNNDDKKSRTPLRDINKQQLEVVVNDKLSSGDLRGLTSFASNLGGLMLVK
ncbi:YSIRK-type signal peptide-containing protein [Macrococcoides canis]|uniref:YSIRK-type signal peptide-containing protein n=1 Tax=Macrococcoides canis TaxID=1855823 RepID=UPI0020B69D1D|nr:SdrD B-like domain-containing protein [Macrococcus canis]UTH00005.1 YSIRK-type signal peptide-containing protein [Macrococcus canis]